MTIEEFNKLGAAKIQEELFKCCGSTQWSRKVSEKAPFSSVDELKKESDTIWLSCSVNDGLEAFTHHPKIGDVKSLEKKFATTKAWAQGEQASVSKASQEVLVNLAKGNEDYEKKFGYIFIVCATGKSAEEMLDLLNKRLPNQPEEEIKIAMNEQNKITHIRIDKLFS